MSRCSLPTTRRYPAVSAAALLLAACAGPHAGAPGAAAPNGALLPSTVHRTAHYAGTFYPLYNSGPGQWIVPTSSMPFDKVSDILVAFAHAYPKGKGATLEFEENQPKEAARLAQLEHVARAKNRHIKILVTLGWGHRDWDYIAHDRANKAGLFVPSVIAFLKSNHLDGFDIDDESIGWPDTGTISQHDFDAVVGELRHELDKASAPGHTFYLVITPAGDSDEPGGIDRTQIDAANVKKFDWINLQTYWSSIWSENMIDALTALKYPRERIAVGVNTERCHPDFPYSYDGLKGIFNWNMSGDSACKFTYTKQIATDVGYPPA